MHNFNITGLEPAAKELKSASSYAVLAPLDNFVIEFALHAINQNFANDIYIVSQDVESFFESSFSAAINTAYKRSKVHPFSLSSETQHYSIERINKGIIKEIGAYKKLKNALVFIHFNTELLSAATEASTKTIMNDYSEFAKKTGVTLLFLLSGPEVTHYRFLIRQLNKSFDGLIFVDNDSATRVLEYDYWHHTTGVFADMQFQLSLEDNKFLVQEGTVNDPKVFNGSHFPDEDDVWLVQSAVPIGTKLPTHYYTVKDNNELFDKGPKLKAATLVFAVTRYTDLAQLGKQCFELRKSCGRWLKLVVQNVDGVIRHQDECLFLTLGVNLILYSFSEPSRLLSQIQSIQGFQFSRPLPPSVEHVLKYTENTFSKGYLPFDEFTRQVEVHSDSAVNLGVSGVLVKLELLPRIEPIHPLHLFHIKREGDVFSLADNTVYLYLHACRENDVNNAIKHLFKLQTSDFFVQQNVISDHFHIQQECKQLRRLYSGKHVTDYSKQLTENDSYKFEPGVSKGITESLDTPEFTNDARPDAVSFVMRLKA
ncbi:cellulose biosynthesis protein BcsE [Pseudoalteromonas sp. S554]|uniref:cellulose biosynthesis protein BcsE n=1 Tax=Pseudoalteromonas sp. S554 TaxID=2066516 RepID=UPI00110CCF7B|nr:cellulose biosynthesis protein BcsE [Pseudoalteromonas sp. S554]TMS81561.1 cellulose biosynthesis protein BcsE [Pseudoalteromonas sp. S554]